MGCVNDSAAEICPAAANPGALLNAKAARPANAIDKSEGSARGVPVPEAMSGVPGIQLARAASNKLPKLLTPERNEVARFKGNVRLEISAAPLGSWNKSANGAERLERDSPRSTVGVFGASSARAAGGERSPLKVRANASTKNDPISAMLGRPSSESVRSGIPLAACGEDTKSAARC